MTPRAVIVATMWDGARVIGPSPLPALSPEQLDAIAVRLTSENGGVTPTIRVVKSMPRPRRRFAAGTGPA